jgi:hypothetical protein
MYILLEVSWLLTGHTVRVKIMQQTLTLQHFTILSGVVHQQPAQIVKKSGIVLHSWSC